MNQTEISDIIAKYDADTLKNCKYGVVNMVGDVEKSIFLRTLSKKAKKLGVVDVCNESSDRFKTVVDLETAPADYYLYPPNDIDCTDNPGISSIAEAVLKVIEYEYDGNIEGKHILIIGRKHSVKGLAEALINNDASVTIVHSKSKNVDKLCEVADAIVTCTNTLDLSYYKDKFIVNIASGTPKGLSELNISILLNRAIKS